MLKFLGKRLNTFLGKVMSTEILIKADVGDDVLEECYEYAKELERKLSAYIDSSYVSRINLYAGVRPVECPEDVIEIISLSLEMAERTGGLFDPTVGVVIHSLFGFGTAYERIPDDRELELSKEFVDYERVHIRGSSVYLERMGMRLDLGGIAKGWTASKIANILMDRGASKLLVSVGGEICTYGHNWKIAIKSPDGGYAGLVETLKDATSISTSGTYERYIKDESHHHIIDTRSIRQKNIYRSLTVISEGFVGGELDALTTACFNLNVGDMYEFSDSFLAIKSGGEIVIGKSLTQKIKSIVILSDNHGGSRTQDSYS